MGLIFIKKRDFFESHSFSSRILGSSLKIVKPLQWMQKRFQPIPTVEVTGYTFERVEFGR
jgi:hypothetical protein